MTDGTPSAVLERVWSLPVRIAHWSLAVLVLIELFNDAGDKAHRYLGYAALLIVVLRVAYGFFSRNEAARVSLPSLRHGSEHLRSMLRRDVARERGHNPLGALMGLTIWMLVALLGLTGWLSRWDRFWGEDWPIDWHAWLSRALQVCVVLHLLGVVVSSVLEKQNLARAMISGKKYVDAPKTGT